MPSAKAKIKASTSGAAATVNCSPLKRRRNLVTAAKFPPVVAMSFKNTGVRRIVSQYSQMENEMMTLRRRYFESRQKVKALKAVMNEQRAKSRQLIVSCAMKLHEKEKQLEDMEKFREQELSRISRELLYLQANLQKKQKALNKVLKDKDAEIARQAEEIESLRKEQISARIPLPPSPAKSGLETPASTSSSSDEGTPKRKSAVPKFCIKPKKSPARCLLDMDDAQVLLPPPLPPPRVNTRFRRKMPPFRGHPADEAFLCTPIAEAVSTVADDEITSKDDSETASLVTNDEGFSSCQEEAPKHFEHFLAENGLNQGLLQQARTIETPSASVTNRHKTCLKPSDVKNRRYLRPKSSELTVLEEHEVTVDGADGKVKTVTHWTGPFV